MRKYIADTKAKGATSIICSLVTRSRWKGGREIRDTETYVKWALEAAEMEGAYFIDLNDLVATKYEELGQQYVTDSLFLTDHIHTNGKGAMINAQIVARAIKKLKGAELSNAIKFN